MKTLKHFILISCLFLTSVGISYAATAVTINFEDSNGDPITSGATLTYYDSGWKTATNNNDGTFTANINGSSTSYHMVYANSSQTIVTSDNPVTFSTVATTAIVKDSDGNTLSGGTFSYYGNGWSSSYAAGTEVEILPGNFSVRMNYNTSSEQKNSQTVSGSSTEIEFTTVTVTPTLLNCDEEEVSGGTFSYYRGGWSSNYNVGTSIEVLPGTFSFRMKLNGTGEQKNGIEILGTNTEQEVPFYATQMNYVYGGNISYYANGWHNYTPGMYLLPGSYSFKFGNQQFNDFEIFGCSMDGNVNIFKTVKHDGSPLSGIKIERNHRYSSYTYVGTTDANGILFTTNQPDGPWKYKATKDRSTQYIISGPNTITFQTSEFVTHVMHTDGSPFEGIETEYNHEYSSYMNVGTTDASGDASIELFPGDYKFKATKDRSVQYKNLEILTSGTSASVDFQTSTFVTHVMDHDGNPFEGIKTEYNHYYSSYMGLSPSTTDASGNASIELFPGEYKFKATKHFSTQTKMFEIPSSGVTASVNFQTALAEAHVKDCDLNTGVEGVAVEYNHYYSSYMDLNPNTTDASGIASIELFPGTYKFKATIHNSSQTQTVAITGPVTIFEFNPTRVTLNYPGTVKYNHYYSSYLTIGDDTYLFPGTYNFRFYNGNTVAAQMPIEIAGCSMDQSLIFVQLQNSQNSGLAGGDFKYRIGWGGYTGLGTDASGNGMWTFVDGHPTNTKVTVSYEGASVEKQQNITTNPIFIFNTVDVTADLRESGGALLNADSWEYRYGWGGYNTLNASGHELLPVNTKVRVGYKGTKIEKQQNAGSNSHFDFATINVTADLKDSQNGLLTADSWEYRYGWGSYAPMNNLGEELLPVNVKVRVGYKGTKVEKQQNVGSNSHYDFNTVNVTADLKSSTGGTLTADNWKYRYGWGAYSTLDNAGEELLPVNVKVKVYYKGACVEKQQNVGSNSNYNFNTVLVTADLEDGNGGSLTADAWDYRYGWGAYSSLNNAGEELLPVNVKVRATYNGTTKEKQQNVGSNSSYLFNWNGSSLYKSVNDYDFSAEKVSVYPNPSDGKFMIENVANYFRLSIYDMTGKVVYQSEINDVNNQNIILDNPVSGAYMIQLEGVGSTVTTPIMIK
ncbi:MAG: T9SS type A sorting domain-containing protein [Ignavibacteriae bacterium]|nr:T9SS type A sorting domain-containing protein [Ignavibacteriota bacterium]MCB9220336.1 T9SS type A sorting domain-containing protein [Ignavibacteria bacterium]